MRRTIKIFKFTLILLLIFGWVFQYPPINFGGQGWPQIWNNPSFPPKIQIARADATSPTGPGTSAGAASGSCSNAVNWGGTGTPGGESANDTTYDTITGNNFDSTELTDELQISSFGFALST